MKVLGLIGAIVLLAACNNTAPTATTYKQQLGGAATGSNNPGTGNSTAGDATAGKTAFTSKGCGGCHNGTVAKDFKTASPSGSYKLNATSQALNPAHTADLFSGTSADGKNIEAYINSLSGSTGAAAVTGDAKAGETFLTKCAGCHVDGGLAAALDASVLNSFTDKDLMKVQYERPDHSAIKDLFATDGNGNPLSKDLPNVKAALTARGGA